MVGLTDCDMVKWIRMAQTSRTIAVGFTNLLLLTSGVFFSLRAASSPIPAMGSSILSSPCKAFMFNVRGFTLSCADTDWVLAQGEPSPNEISMRFQAPEGSGFLSIKTESL